MTKQKTLNSTSTINYDLIQVRLNGVGWNASINNNSIILNVGYSHPVKIIVPSDIIVNIINETLLEIKISDSKPESKSKIGDFVASLLRVRPWNPYSGHGIIRMDRTNQLTRRRGKR